MEKKSYLAIIAVAGLALAFAASMVYAGTVAPEVLEMNNPGFAKHSKGLVQFSHKKHAEEYGATCGDCHHDDTGKPRDLKDGDDVQGCGTCHSVFEFDKADKKMKKAEKIKKYYEDAIHANCVGCHKDHNKENKIKKTDPKAAPTSCAKCHPKKKK